MSDLRDGIMTDENWLSSLERFPYEALTEEQKLEYDTLRSLLKTELKSSEVLEYSECLGPTTGIQAQLPLILAEYHFGTDRISKIILHFSVRFRIILHRSLILKR